MAIPSHISVPPKGWSADRKPSINGKGDSPRNCFTNTFRDNYDDIFRKKDKVDVTEAPEETQEPEVATICKEVPKVVPTAGERLYSAYSFHAEWKSFNGSVLPLWADVIPEIQSHWEFLGELADLKDSIKDLNFTANRP